MERVSASGICDHWSATPRGRSVRLATYLLVCSCSGTATRAGAGGRCSCAGTPRRRELDDQLLRPSPARRWYRRGAAPGGRRTHPQRSGLLRAARAAGRRRPISSAEAERGRQAGLDLGPQARPGSPHDGRGDPRRARRRHRRSGNRHHPRRHSAELLTCPPAPSSRSAASRTIAVGSAF